MNGIHSFTESVLCVTYDYIISAAVDATINSVYFLILEKYIWSCWWRTRESRKFRFMSHSALWLTEPADGTPMFLVRLRRLLVCTQCTFNHDSNNTILGSMALFSAQNPVWQSYFFGTTKEYGDEKVKKQSLFIYLKS